MRKPFRAALAAALILCASLICTSATADDADIIKGLNRIFARYDAMGACVAVIESGDVTHTYCYGTERNYGEAVTPDTCFRVGSISKLVSAIGLMRLVEDGVMELDDELGELFGFPMRNPAYPNTRVTLRQVMTHTAGLRDSAAYNGAASGSVMPLDYLFGEERAKSSFNADIEAGTSRDYSNFGGGLTGSLLERLTGMPLQDCMEECLFEPLNITAAYSADKMPEDAHIAAMYNMPERTIAYDVRKQDLPTLPADYLRDYAYTAGKLIISAPDLAKIMIALCDGGVYKNVRVLKESTVSEMMTAQNFRGSVKCQTDNGLFINIIVDNQVEGRVMYGHGGKAHGMLCAAYFDPIDRTGVVMLTNGCRNNSVYNGTGMFGRAVMTYLYKELELGLNYPTEEFLVDE